VIRGASVASTHMNVTARTERVTAADGLTFDARTFGPGRPGPGVLLLQEIYGVGDFLCHTATRLAELGYVVMCPDVFWRVEPNVSLAHDDEGLARGFEYMGRFAEIPAEVTRADLVAALEHLQALGDVDGKVASMGYCLGGRLAFEVAADGSPDACVSYYGSGIANELELASEITCPILFHFGGSDPYISRNDIEKIAAAFSDRADVEVVVQDQAGHAFENAYAPQFSNPQAAAASWPVTVKFLERTLRQ
jgi:carboxymethylenebutenolidase